MWNNQNLDSFRHRKLSYWHDVVFPNPKTAQDSLWDINIGFFSTIYLVYIENICLTFE